MPRDFTNQFRHFTGERMLRANVIALVHLVFDRIVYKLRLPAKHVHTKTIQHINVFVAIEIPHARALRARNYNLINDFFEHWSEAIHHARISQMRAMRDGVFLRELGARNIATHKLIEARTLALG